MKLVSRHVIATSLVLMAGCGGSKPPPDVDECATNPTICPAHGECRNTPGSYECIGVYTVGSNEGPTTSLRVIDLRDGSTLSATTIVLRASASDPDAGIGFADAGPITDAYAIQGATGLAAHPTTGQLYVSLKLDDLVRVLATLETDGTATAIGFSNVVIAGLAFDDAGTLYAIEGYNGTSGTLYTMDLATGQGTMVATLSQGDDGETLGYSPATGLLYHPDGHSCAALWFESVDPASSFARVDIPIDDTCTDANFLAYEEVQAILWWPSRNAFLWKQNHGLGRLFVVDLDGSYVPLATPNVDTDHQIKGMAFAPL